MVDVLKFMFIVLFDFDYLFGVFFPQAEGRIVLCFFLEENVLFHELLFLVTEVGIFGLQIVDNSFKFSDDGLIFLVNMGPTLFKLMHLLVNIDIVDVGLSNVLGMSCLLQETRSPPDCLSFFVFHSVKCKIYC